MLEEKLESLIKEAQEIRKKDLETDSANYYNDRFYNLSNFISNKLNSMLFKNRNAKIIVNHFDEILPYMVRSNVATFMVNGDLLIKQTNFKEKFVAGLKNYPYQNEIGILFYSIWVSLGSDLNKFNNFITNDILEVLASLDLNKMFSIDILNKLNTEKQKIFLKLLIINKYNIPYSSIDYKEDAKQIIYDNITLFIENSKNLYNLLNTLKDNQVAFLKVKSYIDNNEEMALNSIFFENDYLAKIKDLTLKEIIRLIILDVMKNENVKFSDITFDSGGFSNVLLVGNKVIKLGSRLTKKFSNNPYIIAPLLRRELKNDEETCFVEVTERVNTTSKVSNEELYQLFKNLRNLGLVWIDVKDDNVGRLKSDNIIYWHENLEPSEDALELESKRGVSILKQGDLVILDADFIYDEKNPNIKYSIATPLYQTFEKRYRFEKLKEKEEKQKMVNENESNNHDLNEHIKRHR